MLSPLALCLLRGFPSYDRDNVHFVASTYKYKAVGRKRQEAGEREFTPGISTPIVEF